MSDVTPVRGFSRLPQLRALTGMLCWILLPTLLVVVVPETVSGQGCDVTGDIPFTRAPIKPCGSLGHLPFCLRCLGPYFRTSQTYLFKIHDCDSCQFYAANLNRLSPLGKWSCFMIQSPDPDGDEPCPESDFVGVGSFDFCQDVQPYGDYGVTVTVNQGNDPLNFDGWSLSFNGNSVHQPPPPCSSSVSGFLGDHPDQSAGSADLDTFRFQGTAGDQLTVRLEADPRAGHNGGTARLVVRDESSGLSRSTVGTLPLELTGTLPTTGRYAVEVGQPDGPKPFLGSYFLRVKPTTGSISLLEPAANVEK